MKIILLADVKNLGKKGETVTVNDGYAANFLIPRKLAVASTTTSQAILQKENEAKAKEKEEEKAKAIQNQLALKDITLEFTAKASPDGRMMGTISPVQIEKKLKEEHNIIIDKRKFIDKYPVNAFGFTRLKIELFKDIIAMVSIHVSEEK